MPSTPTLSTPTLPRKDPRDNPVRRVSKYLFHAFLFLGAFALVLSVTVLFRHVSAAALVSFVGTDKATQGNWVGIYGSDGYSIPNGPQLPANGQLSYGSFATLNTQTWTWAAPVSDPRAPEIDSQGDRSASALFAGNFQFDVNFTDGQQHQVALYLLDWDGQGRSETIQITDATNSNSAPLDVRNIPSASTSTGSSDFANGTYLIWNISGHVTITVVSTGGPNAVVSGIFFGANSSGTGAHASAGNFHFDNGTQGNWLGTYGVEGFSIAASQQSSPSYDPTFAVPGQNFVWNSNLAAGATNALETGTGGQDVRIASTWYAGKLSFDLNFTDGKSHSVALYALDWDNQGRAETFTVQDATSGNTLDSESVSNFTNGTYLVWTITGHVTVNIANTAGPNAVISGIFFGGGGAPLAPATAQWIGTDLATQGAWIGKYGSQGYSLAHSSQKFLIPATFTVIHAPAPWLWANNPAPPDPRDLETDTLGHQIAAAWYDASPCTFSFDLNLADGLPHQVAFYLMDWDNQSRHETLQITDANLGTVLDSREIPGGTTNTVSANFTNGVYFVWVISGHVRVNVNMTSTGENAVASGIFLDPHN